MQKFFKIYTYGCQMNEHESEKLAFILTEKGYTNTDDDSLCDVIVFNTCCIRENAEQRAFGNIGALKKLKQAKPSLIVAVGGCMPQQEGKSEVFKRSFPLVDIVFGTHNLEEFGKLLDKKIAGEKKVFEILDKPLSCFDVTPSIRDSYPNAYVNVSQGCDNYCTYCIVPYVRGRERSREIADVYEEVRSAVRNGYKEITLLGQNVNSYGKDLSGGANFAELIKNLSEIDGDYRLRFMSNHPKDLTEELVRAVAENDRCCHSIHLPVQSGSDRVLKLMNRHYGREDFFRKVDLIRRIMPDCAVSTDIMIGFPTETEEDFLDTLDLVERVGFSSAFTFVYSRRKGTVADRMDGQIDEETKKSRITRLVDLQNEISRAYSMKAVGETLRVLCEDFSEKRGFMGRDEYGRMAYFKSDEDLIGKFVSVKIDKTEGVSLLGHLAE